MGETRVIFEISDPLVQKLFDAAQEKCRLNERVFSGRRVLIEGGGYNKVWIETQPMGGAMYAKRDLEIAWNNQKIFMDHQREDGRLPGSIELQVGRVIPQYDKFQGFYFAEPALDVWYLTGKSRDYLVQLYEVLGKYDEYLWKVRDSDNDGCLESWCRYDTGEDNAVRYGDAPNYWESDEAPKGCSVVPMASMDFMGYSYSAKSVMAQIAELLGRKEAAERHLEEAGRLKAQTKAYLWDDIRGAFFDRDRYGQRMPVLIHNNLRMMYWGNMENTCAERFVREHLLNEREFWTPMPLPSVAADDPMFRNDAVNSWSGQPQALTYQRAIRALENYGYTKLLPVLGRKLFEAIGEDCIFVQQYDPVTMKPSPYGVTGQQDAYGPAMLAVLEYISRMYGVDRVRDRLVWSGAVKEEGFYEQHICGETYRIEHSGGKTAGFVGGREVFCTKKEGRIVTDLNGKEIC